MPQPIIALHIYVRDVQQRNFQNLDRKDRVTPILHLHVNIYHRPHPLYKSLITARVHINESQSSFRICVNDQKYSTSLPKHLPHLPVPLLARSPRFLLDQVSSTWPQCVGQPPTDSSVASAFTFGDMLNAAFVISKTILQCMRRIISQNC